MLIAICLLGIGISLSSLLKVSSTPEPNSWLRVDPKPVERRLGLVGRIEAASQSSITAPFDGLIETLVIGSGQRAERGQRLLTLDTTQLDIQLRQAWAEQLKAERSVQEMKFWEQSQEVARARRALTNAQLDLNDTERKLLDTQGLLKRGIVPRMELDALEQQVKVQRLELTAAQAELSAAREKGQGENRQIADMELKNAQSRYQALQVLRDQREITAPFSGILLSPQNIANNGSPPPTVQSGTRVVQGMTLFELANLEQLQALAHVDEIDLNQLHEGQPVTINGDGFSGITLFGRVQSIGIKAVGTEISSTGATYEVIVSLPPLSTEQQQRVRLGMSARLTIITYNNPSAMVVPFEALRLDNQQKATAIYRRDMTLPPEDIALTLGQSMPEGVEVLGLNPGFVKINAYAAEH